MFLLHLLLASASGIRIAAKTAAPQTVASPTRRGLLSAALYSVPAVALAAHSPTAALALDDLSMPDLSAPESPKDLSAPAELESGFVAVTTVDPTVKKKSKINGTYARIKELQSQGSLTDKEKKELKRLKAEEMCEMLGKGC